ncbi:hypothetical protein J6Q66_03800 [bacterium]|nr:hypothetical protein [bacterium]
MINSVNSNQMNNQMLLRQPNGLQQHYQHFDATQVPQNNSVNNKIDSTKKNPLTTFGMFIGSWFGLSKVADLVNSKVSGSYQTSMAGKIGNFGDKIGSTSGYKWVAQKMTPSIQGIKNFWAKHNESNMFLRFLKNPSKREWKMASSNASYGYIDEISMDVIDIMRGFKNTKGAGTFNKAFGHTYEYFEAMNSGAYKHANELESALKKAIDYCKKNGISEKAVLRDKLPWSKSGREIPKILGRNVTLSEAYNKLQVAKGLKNPFQKTALGKLLPKWSFKTIEGLTNGTAGGKLMIAMQAYCLADAIKRTWEAPKGEKFSTFMESMANDIGMYMMIPLYPRVFNVIGGTKYLGMTTAQKNKYLTELGKFNTLAKSGYYKDKNSYKAAKKIVTDLRGAGSKWYLKPFRAIGRISDFGCERIYPFLKKQTGFITNLKKFGHALKGGTGIVRGIIGMVMIAPLFAKPVVKISHAIFGKPTNSVLDDGKAEEKAAQQTANHQLNPNQLFAPVNPDGTNAVGLTPEEMAVLKQQNLTDEQIMQVAQYKQQHQVQNQLQNQRMQEIENATPLPANSLLHKPMNSAKGVTQSSSGPRTYIPSPVSKIKAPKVGEHVLKTFAHADLCAQDAESVLRG